MINAQSILGGLMQAGLSRSSGRRVEHAVGRDGSGGMLGGLLGQLGAANPAAIGGLGALAGAVIGGGRGSTMRGAVGGGALALLGTLAFDALRKAGAAGSAAPPPPEVAAPNSPIDDATRQSRALVLMRAMVNAAKADGNIDGAEMNRILGKLDEAGEDAEAKDFVLAELRRPFDLEGLAAQVQAPDLAAEVYAASLLAIEVDTPAEQAYLRDLAARLRIDPAVVGRLHAQLGVDAQA